jgi:hypothetical protein
MRKEDVALTPLTFAWEARLEDEEGLLDDLVRSLVSEAFKGASPELINEVVRDVLMAPVLSYPGRSVRPLCKACGGVSMTTYLLMEGMDIRFDPRDRSTWDVAPCPRCGGTGTEPEEGAGLARADEQDMWADISWDWPPELYTGDLAQEFGLFEDPSDEGYNGPEAR